MMDKILVRCPHDLHARIQAKAAQCGQSQNAYIIELMADAVAPQSAAEAQAELRKWMNLVEK